MRVGLRMPSGAALSLYASGLVSGAGADGRESIGGGAADVNRVSAARTLTGPGIQRETLQIRISNARPTGARNGGISDGVGLRIDAAESVHEFQSEYLQAALEIGPAIERFRAAIAETAREFATCQEFAICRRTEADAEAMRALILDRT